MSANCAPDCGTRPWSSSPSPSSNPPSSPSSSPANSLSDTFFFFAGGGADAAADVDARIRPVVDAFARATAETEHHPACTNKMGYDDMAVVDKETRVHGCENLRIVDASIMPQIVTANLNATCIMLGEKAADMIAGKEPLEPEYTPFYRAENWESAQR